MASIGNESIVRRGGGRRLGDLYIADTGNNRVVKVVSDGTMASIGSDLNRPSGVAVDASGDLYIADTGNNRVVKVVSDGTMSSIGSDFNRPSGVAVDASGAFTSQTPGTTESSRVARWDQSEAGGPLSAPFDGARRQWKTPCFRRGQPSHQFTEWQLVAYRSWSFWPIFDGVFTCQFHPGSCWRARHVVSYY